MNRPMLKFELQLANRQLALENAALRKQVGDLEFQLKVVVPAKSTYPCVDNSGRVYRLTRGIRCYPN